MSALLRLFEYLPWHHKPRQKHDWLREQNMCSQHHIPRVADPQNATVVYCPQCRMLEHRARLHPDVSDVPTKVLSERPLSFESGPAHEAVDYRSQFEKDKPHPFPDWLNSARDAWAASVEPPVELSPEHTAEHQTPGLHWLKYKRYNARQLNGELPRQNKPDA